MVENKPKVDFVSNLFRHNLAMTLNDVNFAVKQKFGEGIRRDKIIEIKQMILAETPAQSQEVLKAADLAKILQKRSAQLQFFYDFFNRQDTAKLLFTETDISQIEQIEGDLKHG